MATAIQNLPQQPLAKNSAIISRNKYPLRTALPALKQLLSTNAAVYLPQDEGFDGNVQRFSQYKRPLAGAAVCPANESDIVATIKWATSHGINFLAQVGGHGWSTTLSEIGPEDVLINLRAMNKVEIDSAGGTATLEAGATTGEVLKSAQDAGVHIVATACNGVGAISSLMGGGISHHVSNFGLGLDNIVSARLITANGSILTVSQEENPDLFWALRGAGHNFGIVSEMTVKAYPQINKGQHWSAMLGFPGSKEIAEKVLSTIEEMGITKGQSPEGMSCTVVYGRPAPTFEPTVLLKLSFNGPEASALSAFAPLYALGNTYTPSINNSKMMCADEINDAKDALCCEGGPLPLANRPVHSASLDSLDISTMGNLYQRWEEFTGRHGTAEGSIVRINYYDYRRVREVKAEDTAFAWRERPINVLQHWAYTDNSMNEEVQELGKEFRQALTGGKDTRVIMSFASGNERPEAIYGEHAKKLRAMKETWDPEGVFSFYNSC